MSCDERLKALEERQAELEKRLAELEAKAIERGWRYERPVTPDLVPPIPDIGRA